jgi:hypothetical protein
MDREEGDPLVHVSENLGEGKKREIGISGWLKGSQEKVGVHLEIIGELGLTVRAPSLQGLENCFAAVFANKNFSDELVVRTVSGFKGPWNATCPTEQDRFESTIHEDSYPAQARINERVREI